MKAEKRQLIHDLLDAEAQSRRDAVLLAGGRILRRRRQWRVVRQVLVVMAILGIAALCVERWIAPAPVMVSAVPPPAANRGELTDAELLALFPKTPVGLATLANGQKRIVFPHPGDEQRLITRL